MKECKTCKHNNYCLLALTCIPYNYKYHETMKSILGTEIPERTRGVLYLCKFDPEIPSIKVAAEIFRDNAWEALELYANIPNPESQLVTGRTYEGLIYNLELLHKNMKDPAWLKELSECL